MLSGLFITFYPKFFEYLNTKFAGVLLDMTLQRVQLVGIVLVVVLVCN